MPCHLLEDGGIGGRDVLLAQLDLRRGPGEIERALRGVRAVIAVRQIEGLLPRRRDQGGEGDRRRLSGTQPHARAEREDGIEHRAGSPRERPRGLHRDRLACGASAPDEAGPVGLARHLAHALRAGIGHVHAP
jgi:hypothetical protein